jgi:hypothetical protein
MKLPYLEVPVTLMTDPYFRARLSVGSEILINLELDLSIIHSEAICMLFSEVQKHIIEISEHWCLQEQ